MTRAVLHIGLEKTGTTAIQEFLQANRLTLLERHRIWTSDYLGRGSQWLLAVMAYDGSRDDDLTANLGSSASREAKLDEIRKKITYSARHQPADLFCFSSEHLSSRLVSIKEIQNLKQFLTGLFDDITIVLYVRDPIRMAISRQSTFVKLGLGPFQLPAPAENASVLDFRAVIHRWESVFGDSLNVRLYEESSPEFDLIADFGSTLGLLPTNEFLIPPDRVNPSLDWDQLRLMSAINTIAHQQLGQRLPNAILQHITAILEKHGRGKVNKNSFYRPTNKQQDAYKCYFAEQVDWLFRTYFPGRPYQWDPPSTEEASELEVKPSNQLTSSEIILCQLVVSLAGSTSVAWAEIAEHLALIAWKIAKKETFNEHDQEASERFCTDIKLALSNGQAK